MIGFLVFLLAAACQDLKYRGVEARLFWAAGGGGIFLSAAAGRSPKEVCCSVVLGLILLLFSRLTDGAIGAGDGWFFAVAGLYLKPEETLLLFLSGALLCCLYSLVLSAAIMMGGGTARRMKIPFLPFLIPMGLWLVWGW